MFKSFNKFMDFLSNNKDDICILFQVLCFLGFFCWIFYSIKIIITDLVFPILWNETMISFYNVVNNHVIENKSLYIIFFITFFLFVINIVFDLDVEKQLKTLDIVKNEMYKLVNPKSMYKRLGGDILRISCSLNLVHIFEPRKKDSVVLPLIAGLRLYIAHTLGFVFPFVRVLHNSSLADDEYIFAVQEDDVFIGNINEQKKLNFDLHCSLPEPSKNLYEQQSLKIIDDFGDCIISHIESILTKNDVLNIVNYAKSIHSSEIYDFVLSKISLDNLRLIFINLLREKVSIRNYSFIFKKIYKYLDFYNTPDEISERLRIDLLQQATISLSYKKSIIYSLELDKCLEKSIKNNLYTRENSKFLGLDKNTLEKLKKNVLNSLNLYKDKEPIIICSKEIRLPLFRFLSTYIPHITIYSKDELNKLIKIENISVIQI